MTFDDPHSLFHAPTRAAGEAALTRFVPKMGKIYANRRNTDYGPGRHTAVSTLSPFIRRRLVLERDVVAAALQAHGPELSEKFIQEVVWRGYFKGWMERRPQIWKSYVTGLDNDQSDLARDRRLRSTVARAEAGDTGIDCFDAWAQELLETGYLHNHTRMWFASIWIFTLDLPWRLGADFFFRHLLDGDPASNTLGWRWVAGLHTRAADLVENVVGLEDQEPEGLPPVQSLRAPTPPDPDLPSALLITEDDCRPEDFNLANLDLRAVATLEASHLRSPAPVSGTVVSFEQGALRDAGERCGMPFDPMRAGVPTDLVRWAQRAGARQIVTPYVPEGPLRDWLGIAKPALEEAGIALAEWRRTWDGLIWPHATAGFFKVKKKIPDVLHAEGLL